MNEKLTCPRCYSVLEVRTAEIVCLVCNARISFDTLKPVVQKIDKIISDTFRDIDQLIAQDKLRKKETRYHQHVINLDRKGRVIRR